MFEKLKNFLVEKTTRALKSFFQNILKTVYLIREHFVGIIFSILISIGIFNFFILPAFENEMEKKLVNVISKNILDNYIEECEIHKQNNNSLSFPNDCLKVQIIKEIQKEREVVIREKGPEGDKGLAGKRGEDGKKGDQGETGPAGQAGDKGDKGDKGDTGDKGDKGDKGDTGDIGPVGPSGSIGPSGPAGTLSLTYGSFFDTTTQTNPVGNVARVVTYNSSSASDGISITNNSKIKLTKTGVYNIQFSIQVYKTDSGTDFVDFWLVKNNNPVEDTNIRLTLIDRFYNNIAAWNYVVTGNAGDEFELFWSSADTSLQLLTSGPFTGPVRPRIPSVILTVVQEK